MSSRDLEGSTCVVTGGNRGIGLATATGLAARGARVVVACRNEERARPALEEIRAAVAGASVESLAVDLSDQSSIRAAASELTARHASIDVLINNASVAARQRVETVDGVELQLAVNHLAYFLLTDLLLPALRAGDGGRVVNVASNAHRSGRIDFDDLQATRDYEVRRQYCRTKLANVLYTRELARRLDGSGVTANCLHPGVIATGLLADVVPGPRFLARVVSRWIGASTREGAETSLHVATAPELASVSGRYFVDCREQEPSAAAQDDDAAGRLWEVSSELTGGAA